MNFLRDMMGMTKVAVEDVPRSFKTPMDIHQTLKDKYGDTWVVFLPETLRTLIATDFKVPVDELLMNKVLATQSVLLSPDMSWDTYEKATCAFCNEVVDFTTIQKPSIMEATWAYVCIKALQPDWDPTTDVTSYLQALMVEDGLIWNPYTGLSGKSDRIDEIKSLWKSVDKFTEDELLGVQIDKLSIIKEYVRSMS